MVPSRFDLQKTWIADLWCEFKILDKKSVLLEDKIEDFFT